MIIDDCDCDCDCDCDDCDGSDESGDGSAPPVEVDDATPCPGLGAHIMDVAGALPRRC